MATVSNKREEVPITYQESERFDAEDDVGINKYLEENGYVVIKNVCDNEKMNQLKESFWAFNTQVNPLLKRFDSSTFDDRNWLANKSNGILASHKFNHSDFLWGLRTLPKVKQVFQSVWKNSDLIVSFDAGNAFRPWKTNPYWLTEGKWWHVDQNSTRGKFRQGKVCIQGLVTLFESNAETGGLCVIPKSHLHHNEFCARAPTAKLGIDFVQISIDDEVLQTMDGILVGAKAGDLILWDSRTIHCNTPALNSSIEKHFKLQNEKKKNEKEVEEKTLIKDEKEVLKEESQDSIIRLVGYVCMIPKSKATKKQIDIRKFQFLNKVSTSHWPCSDNDKNHLMDSGYKIEDQVDLQTADSQRLLLVGYTSLEITLLKNKQTLKFVAINVVVIVISVVIALIYLL